MTPTRPRGRGKAARYRTPEAGASAAAPEAEVAAAAEAAVTVSREGEEIRAKCTCRPVGARTPVGYNRNFLDSYRPGETFYLTADERARLAEMGRATRAPTSPAGSTPGRS